MEVKECYINYELVQGTLNRWLGAVETGKRKAIRMETSLLQLGRGEGVMYISAVLELGEYL